GPARYVQSGYCFQVTLTAIRVGMDNRRGVSLAVRCIRVGRTGRQPKQGALPLPPTLPAHRE
ncbi:MAG TPA: hypothetical protein VF395_21810, partial [Polyangiaceae bacterium]